MAKTDSFRSRLISLAQEADDAGQHDLAEKLDQIADNMTAVAAGPEFDIRADLVAFVPQSEIAAFDADPMAEPKTIKRLTGKISVFPVEGGFASSKPVHTETVMAKTLADVDAQMDRTRARGFPGTRKSKQIDYKAG